MQAASGRLYCSGVTVVESMMVDGKLIPILNQYPFSDTPVSKLEAWAADVY